MKTNKYCADDADRKLEGREQCMGGRFEFQMK